MFYCVGDGEIMGRRRCDVLWWERDYCRSEDSKCRVPRPRERGVLAGCRHSYDSEDHEHD